MGRVEVLPNLTAPLHWAPIAFATQICSLSLPLKARVPDVLLCLVCKKRKARGQAGPCSIHQWLEGRSFRTEQEFGVIIIKFIFFTYCMKLSFVLASGSKTLFPQGLELETICFHRALLVMDAAHTCKHKAWSSAMWLYVSRDKAVKVVWKSLWDALQKGGVETTESDIRRHNCFTTFHSGSYKTEASWVSSESSWDQRPTSCTVSLLNPLQVSTC